MEGYFRTPGKRLRFDPPLERKLMYRTPPWTEGNSQPKGGKRKLGQKASLISPRDQRETKLRVLVCDLKSWIAGGLKMEICSTVRS